MKKFLLVLFSITTIFGLNKVHAAEFKLEYNSNINDITNLINEIGKDKVETQVEELINVYNSDYKIDYPYFFISFYKNDYHNTLQLHLTALKNIDYSSHYYNIFYPSTVVKLSPTYIEKKHLSYLYDKDSSTFIRDDFSGNLPLFYFSDDANYYYPYSYYYSNFDFYYLGTLYTEEIYNHQPMKFAPTDNLSIQSFENPTLYSTHAANSDFLIEPYYMYDDREFIEDENYITIDLNQYSYVIASLKDYSVRDTFTSTMYVKGQLCATTVYNYGTEEKKDYVSGWQTPDCGSYFDVYTRHLNFIRKEDIKNHAVYYFSALDFSKPNFVKINPSLFDLTYITSEEENSPSISIDGENYQTLPYSSLTDSAILTEKNGISNTWTCAKYDTDCFLDSSGIDIDGLFSNPLEILKSIWDSIVSIFEIITEFIELLPPVMQAFLYLAFGVGIALGIIKIIL